MSIGQSGDGPTVGQLVANASKDLSSLVRSEIELAKTELKNAAVKAGTGAGMFAAAAFLLVLVIILLSIAAAFGLTAAGLHPAVAFLIVAGVYLLVAAVLVFVGMRTLRSATGPYRAIETSKESVEAINKAIGRGDATEAIESRPEPGVRR